MPRFKLILEYEGTRYRGWQRQKNARTVQGELDRAVADACATRTFELHGSGRTDAGVHALMQVAHLDVATTLPPDVLALRLNDALPSDINLLGVELAHPRFHARHHATARQYLYQVSRRRTAFGKRYVWWIRDPLDVPAMRACVSGFMGMHDFRSFSDADAEDVSTRVQVQEATLGEDGALILFRFRASHFIWKMVRRLVGVTVGVGRGALSLDAVAAMLRGVSTEPARHTAPPSGLFLERVYYGDAPAADERPHPLLRVGAQAPTSAGTHRTGRR